MSFFANRSSRHAARLGPALTAHPVSVPAARVTPPHWLCCNRHQGEQTVRTGNPFKLALALCLAIPLALAACGGGGGGTPAEMAMPETPAPKPEMPPASETKTLETWPARTEANFDQVATARSALEKMTEKLGSIADAEPLFGSVVQTTSPVPHANAKFGIESKFDIESKSIDITFGSSDNVTCDFGCYFNIDGIRAVDRGPKFEGRSHATIIKEDMASVRFQLFFIQPPVSQDHIRAQTLRTINGSDDILIHSNIINRWFVGEPRRHIFTSPYGQEQIEKLGRPKPAPPAHTGTWSTRGYYLGYAGRNLLSSAPTINDIVFTAFIDGPEY